MIILLSHLCNILLVQQHRIRHKYIYRSILSGLPFVDLLASRFLYNAATLFLRMVPPNLGGYNGWQISIKSSIPGNPCHLRVAAPGSLVRYAHPACIDSKPVALGMRVHNIRSIGSSGKA